LNDWAIERLEAEIAVVSAHLAAAECRWLEMVAEFDRREAWRSWGCLSTAHWLNYRCGLALGAARERVRVARRLEDLPQVAASFATGELSYSKVRAVTRVATPVNEAVLVDLARCMTASYVEKTVRLYRAAGATVDADAATAGREADPVDQYQRRSVRTRWNDDGTLTIHATLPPAEGAMVVAALQRAADDLFRKAARDTPPAADPATSPAPDGDVAPETPGHGVAPETPGHGGSADHGTGTDTGDVPAGTPSSDFDDRSWDGPTQAFQVPAEPWEWDYDAPGASIDVPAGTSDADPATETPPPNDTWAARQADALVAIAETVVTDGLRPGTGPNRHQVVIHIHTPTETAGPSGLAAGTTGAHLDDGPLLAPETARRLMCDASLNFALHGADGKVLNVSARAPTIPSALARAAKLRDGGCVFPGCTHLGHFDLHHIRHRTNGGENSLANLTCVCRVHHRMIHEGGYSVTVAAGRFHFRRPDGTVIENPSITVEPGDRPLREANNNHGIDPGQDSQLPDWDGRHPDYPLIIDLLLSTDGRINHKMN
jgi:hypothetical protein